MITEDEYLKSGNNRVTANCVKSTSGPDGITLNTKELCFFYDPGFVNTASCKSSITFIDGEVGTLRHRGYDILDIAQKKDYLETVYLLLNKEFPDQKKKLAFKQKIETAEDLPQEVLSVIQSFSKNSHPMTILVAAFAALAISHQKNNFKDCLLINVPKIIAYIYRHTEDKELIKPQKGLSYTENFLHMMFGQNNPEHAKILDTILVLHADHEQNASTATARVVASSGANPILAVSAAAATLSGHLHGGANEAVIAMLEAIYKEKNSIKDFIESVKNKSTRLMGFGHRVYKNYDPRAKVLAEIAQKILKTETSDLLKIAKQLEEIALHDEYFTSRKLYPNVDFYSGIILKAMNIPKNMFTPIFALARTSGWVAQISEMLQDKEQKISRPRQIYTGNVLRAI